MVLKWYVQNIQQRIIIKNNSQNKNNIKFQKKVVLKLDKAIMMINGNVKHVNV